MWDLPFPEEKWEPEWSVGTGRSAGEVMEGEEGGEMAPGMENKPTSKQINKKTFPTYLSIAFSPVLIRQFAFFGGSQQLVL